MTLSDHSIIITHQIVLSYFLLIGISVHDQIVCESPTKKFSFFKEKI